MTRSTAGSVSTAALLLKLKGPAVRPEGAGHWNWALAQAEPFRVHTCVGEARACSARTELCAELGELGAVTAASGWLMLGLLLDLLRL